MTRFLVGSNAADKVYEELNAFGGEKSVVGLCNYALDVLYYNLDPSVSP